jgi:predicted dehydrogenase
MKIIMKNNKLQIGIIGCGNIARTKHLPQLAKFKDEVDIVAFCDIVEDRAIAMKEMYGTADSKVFKCYKELLKEDLDAVHVCTPNRSHAEITIAALNAGLHVMCEKPMAKTAEEAKAMVEAAKQSNKLLTIGYQNRFRVDTQVLKSMVDNGDLGEIYWAKAHANRRRGIPTWGVFTNKYEQGGGPLIDIGTHSLDITLWLMNNYKPVAVLGSTFSKLGNTLQGKDQGTDDHWDPTKYEVEDAAVGLIRFENGATVFLESSWILNTTDCRQAMCTLYGTKAGAEMIYPDGVTESPERRLIINTVVNGRKAIIEPDVHDPANDAGGEDVIFNYPGAEGEMRTWIEALKGEGEIVVKPEQAYIVTLILEAIYKSAETGEVVYLNV